MGYGEPACGFCYQPFTSKKEMYAYFIKVASKIVTQIGIIKFALNVIFGDKSDRCKICGRSRTLHKEKWYQERIEEMYKNGEMNDVTYSEFHNLLR